MAGCTLHFSRTGKVLGTNGAPREMHKSEMTMMYRRQLSCMLNEESEQSGPCFTLCRTCGDPQANCRAGKRTGELPFADWTNRRMGAMNRKNVMQVAGVFILKVLRHNEDAERSFSFCSALFVSMRVPLAECVSSTTPGCVRGKQYSKPAHTRDTAATKAGRSPIERSRRM